MIGGRLIWAAAVFFFPELVCAAAQPDAPSADSTRVQQHLTELAHFGANPEGGVSRIAYSDADIAGRVYVKSLMEAAGLDVRIDRYD
jgi:N-carbamoyl-L-amino-acid hydrolase